MATATGEDEPQVLPDFIPQTASKMLAGSNTSSHSSVEKCLSCGGRHKTSETAESSLWGVSRRVCRACRMDKTATVTHHLQNGKAIIDCGATSALGSVDAIESLMQLNVDRHGRDCVTVDPNNRPTFRFGNNGVHNVPNQPVLISVRALRKLGAVIDFPACAVKFCAKMLPESCSATGSGKQMDSGNSNGQVLPHAEPNQPESPSQSPDQNNQLAASAFAQKQQQPVGQLCAFVPLASSQASPCPHHAKGDLCRPDCQDDRVGRDHRLSTGLSCS